MTVLGRFIQLFLLASMVLLLPSLFYLSRQQQAYSAAKDYALMQTQKSQGQGAPPAIEPEMAQAWKWSDTWKGWRTGAPVADQGKALLSGATSKTGDSTPPVTAGAVMPKMENATAKAELGRATWKFLHTMTLRFPDKPTDAERQLLLRFFTDFSQLYPCGECASHFQELLREIPPQTSSRMASALWLCMAHNKVNERLGKDMFPCDKLDETYDCGCGAGGEAATPSGAAPSPDSVHIPAPAPAPTPSAGPAT